MARRARHLLIVLALPLALSGCEGIPGLEGVGEAVGGVMSGIRGAVDPLIGSFLPPAEDGEATPPPRPRPARRGPPVLVQHQATTSAEDPRVVYQRWADRNRAFDRLRTEGLIALYDGETAEAIARFRKAQELRPQDQQIRKLLAMALNPTPRKRSSSMGLGQDDGPLPPPMPQAPGGMLAPAGNAGGGALPPNLNDLLKNLPSGGGDKPDKLF